MYNNIKTISKKILNPPILGKWCDSDIDVHVHKCHHLNRNDRYCNLYKKKLKTDCSMNIMPTYPCLKLNECKGI